MTSTANAAAPVVRSLVNLTVHGAGNVGRPLESGEDRVWVTVEQLELVLDAAVGRNDVHITFDDGNASDVDIALPRLIDRGLRAEFFVLAGLLGAPGRVDANGVRELLAAGMSVGSHGWAHRDWRQISEREADQEFSDTQRVLAALTGSPVRRVAVPFGSYDRHVLRRLRGEGVTRVYTSDGGRARTDAWLQARTSLHRDLDAAWVARLLEGRPSPLQALRGATAQTLKRWRG